ncbi:hypothetical protein FRB96_003368 [Tulasnella sp. 330]|nr:hypothetical protein FRB96_003368 [Tulasnella sp. 330]KAG8876250.1 hypothetical protein FRB97_004324 [Tulasnella sp. 331]KAG8887444.1 hypothetical protein FRB98_009588 [Tulasnella sp. 332]
MTTALERRIKASLDSRQQRSILRRVDEPTIDHHRIDFSSNDYLSLTTNPDLRSSYLFKLSQSNDILGSGGSRLLDGNTPAHFKLETRLREFFSSPTALLFNSGFDANVSIFSTLPHPGDVILLDEYVHASVWDGCRASRASSHDIRTFKHNSVQSLAELLKKTIEESSDIRRGESGVFVAVETLYSMDGDFAPLREIVDAMDRFLPGGNGHIIVDEAHATGIYGPKGRGLVAMLGLEERILVRLHTFGKALASNGGKMNITLNCLGGTRREELTRDLHARAAVVLCSPLVRSYFCNYARPLVFSTAMSHATVISIACSFDVLESGVAEKLAQRLFSLCRYFFAQLLPRLSCIPSHILSLPPALVATYHPETSLTSPIIPLLTCNPRPLAAHLQRSGILARPITYPTVPRSQDRVRICLHASNTEEEIDRLISAALDWVALQETLPTQRARPVPISPLETKL